MSNTQKETWNDRFTTQQLVAIIERISVHDDSVKELLGFVHTNDDLIKHGCCNKKILYTFINKAAIQQEDIKEDEKEEEKEARELATITETFDKLEISDSSSLTNTLVKIISEIHTDSKSDPIKRLLELIDSTPSDKQLIKTLYDYVMTEFPAGTEFMKIIRDVFFVTPSDLFKNVQLFGSLVYNPRHAMDIDMMGTWDDCRVFVNIMRIFFQVQTKNTKNYGEHLLASEWNDSRIVTSRTDTQNDSIRAVPIKVFVAGRNIDYVKIDFIIQYNETYCFKHKYDFVECTLTKPCNGEMYLRYDGMSVQQALDNLQQKKITLAKHTGIKTVRELINLWNRTHAKLLNGFTVEGTLLGEQFVSFSTKAVPIVSSGNSDNSDNSGNSDNSDKMSECCLICDTDPNRKVFDCQQCYMICVNGISYHSHCFSAMLFSRYNPFAPTQQNRRMIEATVSTLSEGVGCDLKNDTIWAIPAFYPY